MRNISTSKGLGKININNFGNSVSDNVQNNLIQNSKFDQDNHYPYDGYDQNYSGDATNGSVIMSKYWHNSPLRYDPGSYATLFRKTFHIAKPSYDILPYVLYEMSRLLLLL
jgi:hypothetical protein